MELRVLGPLELLGPNGVVAMAGGKLRAVLALLAVHVGESVSEDRLVEVLWGDSPPRTATKTLQSYVSRLRRDLADGDDALAIETTPGGYRLCAAEDVLDVARVEALATQAREAVERGDHPWAAVALSEALRTWRGVPLEEFAGEPWAAAESARLAELRLGLLEERAEAELACGRHAALVPELEALTAQHPLRERLWAQRMIALYRSGRQADALRVYQHVRTLLGDELGINPGHELRQLEQRVLDQDHSLDWMPTVPESAFATAAALPSGVVTFLLTDIEGSTALWDADPGAMSAAVARHDQIIADVVSQTGGVVIKSKGEGDSTLSVFQRASEAVASALQIHRSLVGEAWPGSLDLRVRIALHTGEAEERDGDFFGVAINRAARIRTLAGGSEIVMSAATAELVHDHLPAGSALIDVGRHTLRGLRRDEQVFELVRTEPEATDDVPAPRHLLPAALRVLANDHFVGRQEERQRIMSDWMIAAGGSRQAVLIAGEPGIGKTRLAAEIARDCSLSGARVLFGRCDEDVGAAYQPFAQALGEYVDTCPTALLRSVVDQHGADIARVVPEVTRRLPSVRPGPVLDPDTDRLHILDAIVALLAEASQPAPIVLILDDLHWAPKPTLLLLRHLLRSVDPMSILVIGTYRDTELGRTHPLAEVLADLRKDGGIERIALTGLPEHQVIELVAATAADEVAPELAKSLYEQTDGNPFFVGEVLRHLADTDAGPEWRLPEGVKEVIGRRVSRLSPRCNTLLSAASVIGSEVSLRLLEALVADELGDDILDELDASVAARILVEVPDRPGQYGFSHALIRQTLLSELSAARRARLHRRVGQALQSLPGSASPSVLAHHFCAGATAGALDEAVTWSLEAAREAFNRLSFEEAVTVTERALEVVDLDHVARPSQRAQLLSERALALSHAGDLLLAKASGDAAIEAARESGDPIVCAYAATVRIQMPQAGLPEPEAAAAAEDALRRLPPDDLRHRSELTGCLALYRSVNESQGWRTEALATEAVELARASGDDVLVANQLVAKAYILLGSPDIAIEAAVLDDDRRADLSASRV